MDGKTGKSWNYKNVLIYEEALVIENCRGGKDKTIYSYCFTSLFDRLLTLYFDTLQEAKDRIDYEISVLNINDNIFSINEYHDMLNKLTEKEKTFIENLLDDYQHLLDNKIEFIRTFQQIKE